MLGLSLPSSFYSVQESSLWDDTTHIQSAPLETPSQTHFCEVCLLGDSRSSEVENED